MPVVRTFLEFCLQCWDQGCWVYRSGWFQHCGFTELKSLESFAVWCSYHQMVNCGRSGLERGRMLLLSWPPCRQVIQAAKVRYDVDQKWTMLEGNYISRDKDGEGLHKQTVKELIVEIVDSPVLLLVCRGVSWHLTHPVFKVLKRHPSTYRKHVNYRFHLFYSPLSLMLSCDRVAYKQHVWNMSVLLWVPVFPHTSVTPWRERSHWDWDFHPNHPHLRLTQP